MSTSHTYSHLVTSMASDPLSHGAIVLFVLQAVTVSIIMSIKGDCMIL